MVVTQSFSQVEAHLSYSQTNFKASFQHFNIVRRFLTSSLNLNHEKEIIKSLFLCLHFGALPLVLIIILIIKVFMKCKILSVETILSACMHAHMHAHTHARTRTHTHTHTCALVHTCMQAHTHTQAYQLCKATQLKTGSKQTDG